MDTATIQNNLSQRRLPTWNELPELDLYMDQVVILLGKYLSMSQAENKRHLTPAMVNNYVKMGAMPAPVKKKYAKTHIAHLIIICVLKQVLPIVDVCALIKQGISDSADQEFYERFRQEYQAAGEEAATVLRGACQMSAAMSAALRAQAGQAVAQSLLSSYKEDSK